MPRLWKREAGPEGATIPADELPRRRESWSALSELWLDTELQDWELHVCAKRLFETGYGWDEIARICGREVAPVVFDNLEIVAGIWGYFDRDWLEQAIVDRLSGAGRSAPDAPSETRMMFLVESDLDRIKEYFASSPKPANWTAEPVVQ